MSMEFSIEEPGTLEADALIVPVFEGEDWDRGFLGEFNRATGGHLGWVDQCRKQPSELGRVFSVCLPAESRIRSLVVVQAGDQASFDPGRMRLLLLRVLRQQMMPNWKRLGVVCRRGGQAVPLLRFAVEGILGGAFNPALHKTSREEEPSLREVALLPEGGMPEAEGRRQIEQGQILGAALNLARRLSFEPGNLLPPEVFALQAQAVAEAMGLQSEILEPEAMAELGMGGILAVARGSRKAPRLVVLRHRNAPVADDPPICLVGKGVTFDAGGLSLKPGPAMEEMKLDKSGACAVLGAMQAIAALGIRRNVVALLPMVENLPDGDALRPGDVLRSFSGKTVEVLNTDAEGRLILADAISYACRRFQPAVVIDLATLTGSCVVALGYERAGLFSNDDQLCRAVEGAARRVGEKLWRLPLDSEYRKELDSKIADIKNVGGKWGGAVTAAKFLEEFVEGTPWCHIDMAGQDLYRQNGDNYLGPTGFGVSTLVEFVSGGGDTGEAG